MKFFLTVFILPIFLFIFFCSSTVNAQTILTLDSIDYKVQQWIPLITDNTPGFSLVIVEDGRIVYKKMGGSADLEMSIPIKENTVFNIGSLSKQFTAFLILLLEEENKLSIEDNVSKYLPEFNVFLQNPLKVKDLIYHTSGLREQITMLQLCGWKDDDVYSSDDEKYLLSRQTNLNFTPGTMMQYSNTNYFILALIIEKITGENFSEYCKEKIFIPLEMTTAVVADNHRKIIPNKAEAYTTVNVAAVLNYSPSDDDYGHSSIYCSVDDLKKWADNFSQKKIGTNSLYQKFFAKGTYNNGKEIQSYGYGWFHDNYKGIPDLWHDGARLGFRSGLIYFPDKNVYIITLSNARDFPYADLREKIADYIFTGQFPSEQTEEVKNILPVKTFEVNETQLKQYRGLYWDRTGDQMWNIHFKDGSLYADDYLLVPEGEHLFRLKDGVNITGSSILFYKKQDASSWQMIFTRGRTVSFKSDNSFDYVWVDSEKNTDLYEFDGAFYSDELDIKFEVKNKSDYLELNIRGYEPIKMQPVFKDYFSDPDFAGLYFQRDDKQKITGYIFVNAKANNILFRKIHF